jgi:hypothetical protein
MLYMWLWTNANRFGKAGEDKKQNQMNTSGLLIWVQTGVSTWQLVLQCWEWSVQMIRACDL